MTTTDQILQLERGALDRWGQGDPGGFLDVYGPGITYFDPVTAARIDGHDAMEDYYGPFTGKIHISRYEMLNPQVVVPAHCTGWRAQHAMGARLPGAFIPNTVGTRVEL